MTPEKACVDVCTIDEAKSGDVSSWLALVPPLVNQTVGLTVCNADCTCQNHLHFKTESQLLVFQITISISPSVNRACA